MKKMPNKTWPNKMREEFGFNVEKDVKEAVVPTFKEWNFRIEGEILFEKLIFLILDFSPGRFQSF